MVHLAAAVPPVEPVRPEGSVEHGRRRGVWQQLLYHLRVSLAHQQPTQSSAENLGHHTDVWAQPALDKNADQMEARALACRRASIAQTSTIAQTLMSDKTRRGLPDRRRKPLVVTGPPSMPTPQGVPHVFRCGWDEFHWLSSLLQSALSAAHSKSDPNLRRSQAEISSAVLDHLAGAERGRENGIASQSGSVVL